MQDLCVLQGFDPYKLDLDTMTYSEVNTLIGANFLSMNVMFSMPFAVLEPL